MRISAMTGKRPKSRLQFTSQGSIHTTMEVSRYCDLRVDLRVDLQAVKITKDIQSDEVKLRHLVR